MYITEILHLRSDLVLPNKETASSAGAGEWAVAKLLPSGKVDSGPLGGFWFGGG